VTSGSAQPNVAPTTPVAPTDIVERLDRLIRANNFSATTNAELREAAQTIRELREQVAQPTLPRQRDPRRVGQRT